MVIRISLELFHLYGISNNSNFYSFAHHLTVKKLQFRPMKNNLMLASCGDDNYVRINEIII